MTKLTVPAKADIPISFAPWDTGMGWVVVIIANLIQCLLHIPLLPAELSWDSCPCLQCGIGQDFN